MNANNRSHATSNTRTFRALFMIGALVMLDSGCAMQTGEENSQDESQDLASPTFRVTNVGTFDVNNPGNYPTIVGSLRYEAHGHTIYSTGGGNFILNEIGGDSTHLGVVVNDGTPAHSITLIFRADNLYLIGYSHANNYYHVSDEHGTLDGQPSHSLPFEESYSSLQRWAALSRNNQLIGTENMRQWLYWLAPSRNNNNASDQDRARALMGFASVFAEGARFRRITQDVWDRINAHTSSPLNAADLGLTNNWAQLSAWARNNQHRPYTPQPARITAGDTSFTNLGQLASFMILVLGGSQGSAP